VADARLRTPTDAKVLTKDAVLVTSDVEFSERILNHVERGGARGPPSRLPSASDVRPGRFTLFHACRPDAGGEGLDPDALVGCISAALETRGPLRGSVAAILLEGGGKLAASFMRAGLIDRIEWFRAPLVLGGDAKPALAALELAKLEDAPRFNRLDVRTLGDDLWERYERLT